MPARNMPSRNNSSNNVKFGENWGINFYIKTGGQSYECVLQDRAT